MIKLLIADDEPHIRRGIVTSIPWYEYGIEVVGDVSNGMDGLRLVKTFCPDIVITDVRMPVMDGLEFAKAILCESPRTKVLILSGYANFAYAQKAMEFGVIEYLLKPFGAKELLEKVLHICEKYFDSRPEENIESRYNRIVVAAINYFRIHYGEQITLKDVCVLTQVSESYFSRLFKRETGENVINWVNRYRMEKAKELMRRDHGYKVYEVAEMVGFRDYKYFCKNFSRYTGMSPKKFLMGKQTGNKS
jgi:two-component system response regulator YesN